MLPQFRHLNVEFWSRSIAEVIPAILGLSNITTENPRIFISYRQKDSSNLAIQLFDALCHQGFDAFLDHFRIPPGVNFQARLTQNSEISLWFCSLSQSISLIPSGLLMKSMSPRDTLLMYRLGYATITWVDTAENEKFDPTAESESPCPRSLRAMREAMIRWTKPEAMVCIGGMDGVEREVEMFREFNKNAPIYVLEKTGGASVVLANSRKDVRVIDSEVIGRIDRLKAELFGASRRRPTP